MAEETTEKSFDCVKFMRDARARIDAATAGMTDQERIAWYNSRPYTDPWVEKLAKRIDDQERASTEESDSE